MANEEEHRSEREAVIYHAGPDDLGQVPIARSRDQIFLVDCEGGETFTMVFPKRHEESLAEEKLDVPEETQEARRKIAALEKNIEDMNLDEVIDQMRQDLGFLRESWRKLNQDIIENEVQRKVNQRLKMELFDSSCEFGYEVRRLDEIRYRMPYRLDEAEKQQRQLAEAFRWFTSTTEPNAGTAKRNLRLDAMKKIEKIMEEEENDLLAHIDEVKHRRPYLTHPCSEMSVRENYVLWKLQEAKSREKAKRKKEVEKKVKNELKSMKKSFEDFRKAEVKKLKKMMKAEQKKSRKEEKEEQKRRKKERKAVIKQYREELNLPEPSFWRRCFCLC